ncbi:uncharacterized protein KRP23_6803 [Phytophthora ramorum]|uniref:uncharacterized protein n=1 Tax=Phytophthora ramorum TaxID=164328 RepID=UPI003095F896|nr:hypothetical protein KRP23_6803 [Phytophthora ramorum]
MSQGLDSSLLYCYASLMALNAFVAFYHIQFRWNEATLHHIVKDSIVDAAFAVFFPALILLYSLFIFQDDLMAVKIRQQFFPPRVFERKARNYVSAKELNMFTTDFESLLIRSGWDVFLKLSFSLLACFRWTKITHLLLQREDKVPSSPSQALAHSIAKSAKAVAPLGSANGSTQPHINLDDSRARRHFVQSRLRALVGILFFVYGVGCIVYTAIAVQKSQTACLSYPECVQFAYLWAPGTSQDTCACIAYVDRDLAPADSDSLTDVTQTLTELAGGGKLQTVQLVNRKINGSLPEELQSCQSLRNLVLIHTGVGVFPSWASKSFSKLEYLHIEGDSTDVNLVELPSDLFSAMANLHTIHLSYHPNLPSLPSLAGSTALQSVYYGFLDSIKEFSSVGDLPDLQVVALESLPLLRSLPEIAQYESILDMVFVQDIPACCSGFLSEGTCNTTFPSCCGPPQSKNASTTASNENSQDGSANIIQDGSNNDSVENSEDGSSHDSLPPTCLVMPDDSALLPSNATLLVLSQFATNASNFCDAAQAACPNAVMAAMLKREDICKGVLYRECSSESQGVGICFNEDMGRVQCTYSQATIDMREAEIAAGCRCDKVEEKWLGCA